jgi:hypothetical protein
MEAKSMPKGWRIAAVRNIAPPAFASLGGKNSTERVGFSGVDKAARILSRDIKRGGRIS